jgi:hypothetical protein
MLTETQELYDSDSYDRRDPSGYTAVERYSDGNYRSFITESDTEWLVQAQPTRISGSAVIKLYADGTIEQCVLASAVTLEIFGERAVLAEGTTLAFHSSGAVRTMTLGSQARWFRRDRRWKYRGLAYAPGTTLELSPDGAVLRASVNA